MPHFHNATTTTPILWPLFQENLGKQVPEKQNSSGFNKANDDEVTMAGPYASHLLFAPDR